MRQRFLAMGTFVLSLGAGIGEAGLVAPYVETSFVVFGNGLPATTYGLNTQTSLATSTLNPTTFSTITYSGAANAAYGQLGASAHATAAASLPAGEALTVLAIADFADRLIISSPGSLLTTYRWTPTVRITGSTAWTATGTPGPFATAIASAQYIRTDANDTWVRTSSPDINPAPGPVDIVLSLPEVEVPANVAFNYRMRLMINARVFTQGGYAVTDSLGQFLSTLRVTELMLTDAGGSLLPFTVNAASGASYSVAGISSPVPEPGTFGLVGFAGMALVVGRLRKR